MFSVMQITRSLSAHVKMLLQGHHHIIYIFDCKGLTQLRNQKISKAAIVKKGNSKCKNVHMQTSLSNHLEDVSCILPDQVLMSPTILNKKVIPSLVLFSWVSSNTSAVSNFTSCITHFMFCHDQSLSFSTK